MQVVKVTTHSWNAPSEADPPTTSVQPSLHPLWPESHLKLWSCSGPIDSRAVSKMNGGFRKSILMMEKENGPGKEWDLIKGE